MSYVKEVKYWAYLKSHLRDHVRYSEAEATLNDKEIQVIRERYSNSHTYTHTHTYIYIYKINKRNISFTLFKF